MLVWGRVKLLMCCSFFAVISRSSGSRSGRFWQSTHRAKVPTLAVASYIVASANMEPQKPAKSDVMLDGLHACLRELPHLLGLVSSSCCCCLADLIKIYQNVKQTLRSRIQGNAHEDFGHIGR